MRIHRAWENPPRVHKECRDAKAAQWYEKPCKHCGRAMKIHRQWESPPAYHKECQWTAVDCEICGKDLQIGRDWINPPRSHADCLKRFAPKNVECGQCGKFFEVSTRFQIKCHKQGWSLPQRCEECKHDALLIKGAIGALRDKFPFPLETTIEKRGILFTDKVAVVRNKINDEAVAEIIMDKEGIIFEKRIAKATDLRTRQEISRTKEGKQGLIENIINPKRVVDTYDSGSKRRTHRTQMEKKGVIWEKHFAQTTSFDHPKATIITTTETKGVFFPKRKLQTNKPKTT